MTPLVGVIVTLGMLVVIPLGLRLLDVRPWPFLAGAVAGAPSLWLPRGPLAVALAAAYGVATLYLAFHALPRLRRLDPARLAAATALATPSVAAVSLIAERGGYDLLGYTPQMLALTVAHFHFAGFAAALVAGLVGRESGSPIAALTVPAGTLLVLGGYFVGDWAELAGSAVLTAGMWWVGWLAWRRFRGVFLLSGAVSAVTMALAMAWAVGEATGLPHPPLETMIATHGVGNAFGFALCAVAALRRLDPL
ncbi:YndJ family protein [Nonomuraea mangrovi]|uniref:YndJ family protein n=1 Tax=Nonomuraea mangrovi TaxID=2316207 RepID=A0ABW4SVC7_9ACTN